MAKSTKIEYEKRIFTIQGWIIDGVQPALIIKQIQTQGWAKERQAKRLLQSAWSRWTDIPEADLESKRKLKIAELQQLKRSLKEQYKGTPTGVLAQLAVDKMIIRLEGYAPAQKHILQGDEDKPVVIENKSDVDYSRLSDEILLAIVAASKKVQK